MPTTSTEQHARQDGTIRLGGLLAIAGTALLATLIATLIAVGMVKVGVPHPTRKGHWAAGTQAISEAVAAVAAVVTMIVTVVTFRMALQQWRHQQASAIQAPNAQQRTAVLQRVKHKWIEGVLEPSLAKAARLALDVHPRPEVLALAGRARYRPGRPPEPIPTGTSISEVFEKTGGGLLILGAPGAGKTTLLLKLAEELLDRAKHDPDQPMPVVANLASWGRQNQTLEQWLVEELVVSYTVPRRLARAWADHDQFMLLLDGLDEVASHRRPKCVAALNTWRAEHGLIPLAVCCRTTEFQALATGLRVEDAVELQPLTPAQVDTYLDYLEATGTPVDEVRAALAGDYPDEELAALLHSPLFLHVVALAYRGRSAAELTAPDGAGARQARLWHAFVTRMFEQRPLDPGCGYTTEQATAWLAWLARAMRDRDQTEFHLDRLTSEWLASPVQQRAVRWIPGLALGLAYLVLGMLAARRLAHLLAGDVAGGLSRWLVYGLFSLMLAALAAWQVTSHVGDVEPTERLYWSWQEVRRNLGRGLTLGLAGGLLLGLLGVLHWGIGTGVALGLVGMLVGVLGQGMVHELRDERAAPNEGIRRSARSALAAALVSTVLFVLVGVLSGEPLAGPVVGLLAGLLAALLYGGGACLQHYAIRAALVRSTMAPPHYERFLEAMTQRLLLRRSGSAYLFAHRLLRDHLAAARPSTTSPTREIPSDR